MRRIRNAVGKLLLLTGNLELDLSRKLILENEGYHVVLPKNTEEAAERLKSEKFDIMLVCHSINVQEAAMLVSKFRNANPGGRVIAITLFGTLPEGLGADRAVSGIEGPAALLEAIGEYTRGRSRANGGDSA
jgi:CheY-like chemotaxis protein